MYTAASCRTPLAHITGCHDGIAREIDATDSPRSYDIAGGHRGTIFRATGGCSQVLRPSELGGSFAVPGSGSIRRASF